MDGTGTLLIDPNLKALQIGRSRRSDGINPCNPNEWRELGEIIGDHQNLENLVFGDFVATGDDWKELIAGASRNKSVMEIKFFRCNSERGGWGSVLGSLAAFFENNHKLVSLRVWDCVLGQDAVRSLSEALGSSPACLLEFVDWERTQLAREDWARLVASLAGLRNLKRLEIGHSFRPEGCTEVAGLLRHPHCVLKAISLSGDQIGDTGLAALESAIAANKTLTHLSLMSLGDISPARWRSLFRMLGRPRCWLKLCFNYNTIGDEGLTALQTAITANKCLMMLCLIRMGEISPEVWRSFSSVLRNNRRLKTVILKHNSIDDDAVEAFADAVRGHKKLQTLSLGGNSDISDRGWKSMTDVLCNTSSIDSVYDSNHTLHGLDGYPSLRLPERLKYFLQLNSRGNINEARRQKILLNFLTGNYRSMEPIRNMNSKVFPHLLSWIGRGSGGRCGEAMFNVLWKTPSLFGNSSPVSRRSKRKMGAGSL